MIDPYRPKGRTDHADRGYRDQRDTLQHALDQTRGAVAFTDALRAYLIDGRLDHGVELPRLAADVLGVPVERLRWTYGDDRFGIELLPEGAASCRRCIPGVHGERIDVHNIGESPCEHVAPVRPSERHYGGLDPRGEA